MPTYEYKCTECTERFEVEQKITDDALTSLPGCGSSTDGEHKLKKVFSSIGISFKGDGFYRNDARGGKSSRASSTPASTESSSSSTSSDSSSGTSTSSSNGDSGAKTAPSTTSSGTSGGSSPAKKSD